MQESPLSPHVDLFRLQQQQQAQLKWLHDVSRRKRTPADERAAVVLIHGAIRGLRGGVLGSVQSRGIGGWACRAKI
eukprot:scaffold8090_cov267-Pinguiococcus_pyrenoidosus.AAC.8